MPTPKEIGDALEDRAAEVLQGTKVKQSGGGKFFKSDARDSVFLWSCKATGKDFIRITTGMLREAAQAARGMRGVGNSLPGMVIRVDDEDYVLTRLEDFAALATGEIEPYIEPKRKGGLRKRLSESKL